MALTAFKCLLEMAALGVLFCISLQTTLVFGNRYFFYRRVWMNFSAFLASALALTYAAYKTGYWFAGLGPYYDCQSVLMVAGILQGACNSMAFLHLFQRADAINALNPRWRYLRIFALSLVVANWAVLGGVVVDRKFKEVNGPDGTRCLFIPGQIVFRVKFLVQLVNHVVQSAFFVWPLIVHIWLLDKGRRAGLGTSSSVAVYRHMAKRAVIAMTISSIVTIIVTVLVILAQRKGYPTTVLSITDITSTLICIYFASCSDLAERFAGPSAQGHEVGSSVTATAATSASTTTRQQVVHAVPLYKDTTAPSEDIEAAASVSDDDDAAAPISEV
eukprot:TRINITY_DN206_c4_g1_i2.p1 TRINITY_DN206_c4_g1~~TRINITY_DN206_c4_g1_i2.p1  ORF type:complete len:331 (-),score=80.12 TRINITY_DN206_c4_g1_i2:1304-2296(-)